MDRASRAPLIDIGIDEADRAANDWLDELASLEPANIDYDVVKQAVTSVKDEFGL